METILLASYPALLATSYSADLLSVALPALVKANPTLLASGAFYIAESTDGFALGCGGWTFQRPGAPDSESARIDPAVAHLRHFATRSDQARRGVGRALFERCLTDAQSRGVSRLECAAALAAEPFYRSLGFVPVGSGSIPFGPGASMLIVNMRRELPH